MLSCPSPFGWLETCETVILLSNIAQFTKMFNLVEVADSHRGKVDFVQWASGVTNRDDRGLLHKLGFLHKLVYI